ncbi:MAG: alpha/beta fold hydrolase [Dorea sp.]|nr:alpha/beta fold hydrolase [Dorea sp.]
MKQEFYYPSRDGKTQIHAIEWIPEGEIKGVLQICHGMVEYINRYDEFAEFMAGHDYYVIGHDHLGHGKSIQTEEDLGYFNETRGNQYVIGDIHKLRELTMKKHPGVPYYMLGHSMGSFLLREYLTMYGTGLAGAIIMGTGYQGALVLNAGQLICRVLAAFKGWKYRSKFVDNLSFGSYNKKFEPAETTKDWITSDKERKKKYVEDPLCSYMFTLGAYYQMFEGMKVLTRKDSIARIPKELPILFVSGEDDPVGAFGKGVIKVYEKYKSAGIHNLSIHLYKGDRHEILNEVNRRDVYEDLRRWIES